MKVLHVYKEFHPDRSGVARHIDGLARQSRRLGIIPSVLVGDAVRDYPHLPVTAGGWFALLPAIYRADVVHLHGARTPIAAVAGLVARLLGRPFVYTPHCYYDSSSPIRRLAKRVWDRLIESRLLGAARATILLDDVWLDYLAARKLSVRHPAVVPNCVLAEDVLARRPLEALPKLTGVPALISIGRLAAVKRLGDIIAALAQPGLERAVFHVVGTGPEQAALEKQAGDLGVAERVVFYGGCDDRQATALLMAADIFVLPSEREGGPTAVIEALLGGLPVMASDIPGTRAILDRLGTGRLLPVGDIAAWGDALASPPPVVSQDVRERLRAIYSWEARAGEVVALYRG
jgi:glycosyltransferase involved in cell wall biosynthesis